MSFAVPFAEAARWVTDNNGYLIRVQYDAAAITETCRRALAKIGELFSADRDAGTGPDPAHYAELFLEHAIWFAPAFKPILWADEMEWRFVFVRPPSEHVADGERSFIQLPIPGQRPLPIGAVCTGPEYIDERITEFQRTLVPFNLHEYLYRSRHEPRR